MGTAADWHAFLDEFRTFGGKAENVMQRKGAFGLGLFPIDPSKPIELLVPENLLVPVDNVELRDNEVAIKDESSVPEGYANWFRRYQARYSWGAEGRENTQTFEEGLKNLPENVKVILRRNGVYNSENRFPGNDVDQEILQRFIQTRCINKKDKRVIMPMIELLNHAPAAKGYDMSGDGIAVSGMFDGEVLVKYSVSDPFRRLFGYGFNAQEPLAFSLSFRLQHNDQTVVIQGGGGRQPLQPCKIEKKEDRVIIRQPLLGSSRSPKLPRTLFIQACRAVEDIKDANELFDQVHQRNTIVLINILRNLDQVEGDTAQQLRTGCLDQLMALSQHFGVREDLLNQSNKAA